MRTAGIPSLPKGETRDGRRPASALTAAFVRTVSKPGKYSDGNGLYLLVQPSGTRSWIQRLTIRGQRRDTGLGGVPLVSLDEARQEAFANRKIARGGGDPLAEKRRAAKGPCPTFAEAAELVWKQRQQGWRNAKYSSNWLAALKLHAFPRLGDLSVADITSSDVIETLQPIWHRWPTSALRVRQRIYAVLEWAVAMEHRPDNPCNRIGLGVLGRQKNAVRHMPALPHREVGAAVAAVRAAKVRPVVRLAFEFLVLTAARSGEVRLAAWDEIDIAARTWTLPAERMKANRQHRVPLSGRAVDVLEAARELAQATAPDPRVRADEWNRLVFPTPRWGRLKDEALSGVLKKLEIPAVPHGFRSSFRDWVAEETDYPREVVEVALAHQVRNPVEAAYARSDLFERRRGLMDDWATYLAEPRGDVSLGR